MIKTVMGVLGVALVIGVAIYTLRCPCERMPGAWLFGEVIAEPVTDWSFVNDRETVPLCQLQVTTWRPHSINLNCMADEGALYISCSRCADKQWSNAALTHPNARLRAAGKVYPVTLSRLTEAPALDAAWRARLKKVKGDAAPRPDHWWSFRLVSR